MPLSLTFGNWTAAGIWIAIIGVVGIFVRQLVPWAKQSNDAETLFRNGLIQRIEKLERQQERERARHDAERRVLNHQLGNVTQCFDAILLLIEAAPEKAKEHVKRIKDMRARQLVAEAQEKGEMLAAEINAYADPEVVPEP